MACGGAYYNDPVWDILEIGKAQFYQSLYTSPTTASFDQQGNGSMGWSNATEILCVRPESDNVIGELVEIP